MSKTIYKKRFNESKGDPYDLVISSLGIKLKLREDTTVVDYKTSETPNLVLRWTESGFNVPFNIIIFENGGKEKDMFVKELSKLFKDIDSDFKKLLNKYSIGTN